jgi:hypothetical protein
MAYVPTKSSPVFRRQAPVLHKGVHRSAVDGDILVKRDSLGFVAEQLPAPAAGASAADQETATSTTVFVTPAVQHRHPSAAKFWLKAAGNSTTINASYNVTSVADTATGRMTVTIATDFSGAHWAGVLTPVWEDTEADNVLADADPTSWMLVGFGDQT